MAGPFFPEIADAPSYPDHPGWKGRATSKAAAEGVAAKAKPLRERVLDAIRVRSGTPEQIAHRLGEPLMNVRPRLSELSKLGLVEDSGRRATAMGGRLAIVWRATASPLAAAQALLRAQHHEEGESS